jgi:hypothetical protein
MENNYKNKNSSNNSNSNSNSMEKFTNYNDVKKKTINWCTKMRELQILTPEQYDKCFYSFTNTNSKQYDNCYTSKGPTETGKLPNDIEDPSSGSPLNFSMYNTRSQQLSPNLSSENTNTFMIMTNTGYYMACNKTNLIYYVKDIDNSKVKEEELYFTLLSQNDNVYSVMTSYGNYLIANENWGADFSGTSLGQNASWNITKINDNIVLESLEYSGFFLSFINNKTPLKIIYGKDDTTQWRLFPKTNANPNNKYGDYQGTDYIARQLSILTTLKNNSITISVLNKNRIGFTTLKNILSSNYDKIVDYMNKKLTQTSSDNKLTDPEIGRIILNISQMKTHYSNLIDTEISKIDTQISSIDLQDSNVKYTVLLNDIKTNLENTKLNIQHNNVIMGRQQNNYDQIETDETYMKTKTQNYETLNNSLKLNLDIVNNNQSQTSYLVKVYPFIILILSLCLLYLSYITIIKFKKNIASKYI